MTFTFSPTAGALACAAALAGSGAKFRAAGLRLSAVATALILAAHPASAQTTGGGSGSLDSFLTNVANMITGTTGQALAITQSRYVVSAQCSEH